VNNNDPLDRVLQQWTPRAPVPAGFQTEVWRRIATAEAPAAVRRITFGWRAALMSAAAMAVFGFLLGSLIETQAGAADRTTYFARINPLAHSR
jgi:hypothetical protein